MLGELMWAWVSTCLAVMSCRLALAGPAEPSGRVSFQSFASEHGLTNLVMVALGEDAEGAMWVGTDDGLFRLDNGRFVRFGRADGIPSSHINALGVAPNGELCVGISEGLYCGKRGRFHLVALSGNVSMMRPTAEALWISTSDGLMVWTSEEQVPRFVEVAPRGIAPVVWADARGAVFCYPSPLGVTLWIEAPGGWSKLSLELDDGEGPREGRAVGALVRDGSGAIWLRSAGHVWRLGEGEHTARELTLNLPTSYDVRLAQSMAVSAQGQLVVGTADGLGIWGGDYWEILNTSNGLPMNLARSVMFDRNDDLWIGANGVHRRLGRGIIKSHTHATGLPGDAVWAVVRDAHGELLLGSNRCLVRAAAVHWQCVPGTEQLVVRSVVAAPDGSVLFGGVPATLHVLSPDRELSEVPLAGAPAQILSMSLADDGTLWIGTSGGLWRRDPGSSGPPVQVRDAAGELKRFVSAVLSDGPRLWIAGHEGLRVLEAGTWRRFSTRDGLRADAVRYLTRRRDGRVCLLYDEGLGVSCFAYREGKLAEVRHFTEDSGLDALGGYALGEDNAGRLWVGTAIGIRVLSDNPDTPVDPFRSHDGISGDDTCAMAFYRDRTGDLWIGSTDGVTQVAASMYRGPRPAPAARIVSLTVGAQALVGAAPRQAAGNHNDLRATFLSNDYSGGDDYRLRLWPLEDRWSNVTEHDVRFSSLPPGDYHLEIQARVSPGPWGPTTSVAVSIPRAWWQLLWLRVLAAAVLLMVVARVVVAWERAAVRRRTRALRVQADASFRAFVASLPDVVIVQRAGGGLYLNEPAVALFGNLDHGDARWILRYVHPDDRRRAGAFLRAGPDEPAAALASVRAGRAGAWRDLEVSHRTIELAGALAHVLVGRDVTERRRLQAKMLIADRMVSLGTLAAGIGHEINNPLAYVIGNLEVLSEALESGDRSMSQAELRAATRDAIDGAARVRAIVRRLSTFNHSSDVQRIELSVPDVIEQAVRLTHNEVRHRAELVVEIGDPCTVIGDPGQLIQVAINLIINAAHATPPGAADRHRIWIRTHRSPSDGRALLEVADQGVGMSPEVVAHAFDPFYTTKPVGEGTGLGLSICHGIITELGGQISIDSVVGCGTTVRIWLPPVEVKRSHATVAGGGAAGATAPLRADRSERAPAGGLIAGAAEPSAGSAPAPVTVAERPAAPRPRVLVIDDEPAVGKVLARMLRAEWDVTVLTDGESALRRLSSGERFGAIVTDVMMPVLTGLELRQQVLAIDPAQGRRIVFLTGGAFTKATAELLEQLDVPCMTKPVDGPALRQMVSQIVSSE
jgi:signal transduction histidine kinase/ligand-binding sensor domain-containing protein